MPKPKGLSDFFAPHKIVKKLTNHTNRFVEKPTEKIYNKNNTIKAGRKMTRFVYADNAATTPVLPEVIESMQPFFKNIWGNPSSLYSKGREASKALNEAREKIADLLGAGKPNEIYFTSCGSESDNWAIKGFAHANSDKGKHIITSKFEHHAVMNIMKSLEKEGFEVTYLDLDESGLLTADSVKSAIREDTILVAIMYANNEIGTILPIKEIAEAAHEKKIAVFTDAVQAVGHIPVDVKDLGVDMLSFSGHKFNAPKGIGGLYIRNGVKIGSYIDGGGQERGKRGGTENLPYIVGMAKALEIAVSKLDDNKRIEAMRDRLFAAIDGIPDSRINGDRVKRLPGNVNAAFKYIEGESMLLLLDLAGICVSTGSACSSTSLEPSHVLLSIGLPVENAHGSLRISLSHENTDEDVDYIIEKLPGIVQRLRDMSPIYIK